MAHEGERFQGSLSDALISVLKHMLEQDEDRTPLKIGDKVVITEPLFSTYFVPEGSQTPIGKNFEKSDKNLLKFFRQAEAIVVRNNLEFLFNCGHCTREHKHDIIVHYPQLGINYYAKESEFRLVEEIKK